MKCDNVLLSYDEVCQSLTELRLRSRPHVELVVSIGYKWCKLWYLKPLSASTVLFCITTNLLTRSRKRKLEKIIYCNLLLCVKSRNSMHTENTNFAKTKHSRMRTARFPSSGEGSAPWMQTPRCRTPLDADPHPGRRPLSPTDADLPPSPCHVTCDACWEANPHCWQTNTCENITLPKTSFADGNNCEQE